VVEGFRNRLWEGELPKLRQPGVDEYVMTDPSSAYKTPVIVLTASLAHCRRNHFTTSGLNRISTLLSNPSFPKDPVERAATLIDLYIVSVLLDAGAGNTWTYTEKDKSGTVTWKGGRSEGLAVASYHMFVDGLFSSNPENPLQIDGKRPGCY